MSISYTLSDIAADFGSGAKHVAASASPFLELEFGTPPRVFKSTMVKHGGPMVAWQQPVLLTGATTSRLVVTAKSHKSLLPDTTIGTGVIDLAQSAAQSGPTIVPLSGKTGASAGQVQFVVTRGEGAGVANFSQPAADPNGVVEGVGGPGRNIEGGSLGAGTGMGHHHGGPGVGTGAALGAAAAGMGHHDHNRSAGMSPGMGGNNTGMGGPTTGMGGPGGGMGGGMGQHHRGGPGVGTGAALGAAAAEAGHHHDNNRGAGLGNQGGMGGNSGYANGEPGMMQQQPGGMGAGGGMVPQGGPQTGMQQGGMVGGTPAGGFNNGQQQGLMPQQQGGIGGGMTPSETFEKHAHNVHDHDEDETFERRNVG